MYDKVASNPPITMQPVTAESIKSPSLSALHGTNTSDISVWREYGLSLAELKQLEQDMIHNFSHLVHDPGLDYLHSPVWRGLIIVLYVSVILLGIIGNSTVIFVVVRNKNMHNVTNILIANLAASDVALSVFCLPIQLYYQVTDRWVFGDVMCRIIFAAFAVPMYVSTFTILLIAIDRYWLIIYPLNNRLSKRTALLLISAMVFMSIILAIPIMCFSNIHIVIDTELHFHKQYCIEYWPHKTARKVYSILMFSFQFCLPLMATAFLYFKIFCRLKERTNSNRGNIEKKQRTNKILVSIVTLFIICWLPWNLYSLITELNHSIVRGPHFKFTDLLLKFIALTSACVNPFLYCWLNDNFKKELDAIAIKLHVYRQPSLVRRSPRQNVTPVIQENGQPLGSDKYELPMITTEKEADELLLQKTATNGCNNNLTVGGFIGDPMSSTDLTMATEQSDLEHSHT